MLRKDIVQYVKDLLSLNDLKSFSDAAKKTKDPVILILAILFSLGYDDIHYEVRTNKIIFFDEKNSECSLVEYSTQDNELSGHLRNHFLQAFHIVNSIENELTTATMYPMNLREKAIERTYTDAGVDLAFFEKILKNWH